MGWAKSKEDLWLRDTHFPNEVIVRPAEIPNFPDKYIEALNTAPTAEYAFLSARLTLARSSTTTLKRACLSGLNNLSVIKLPSKV